MKETENVPFDSLPPLIRGSFLTKEQEKKLKEPFKDVVLVVRCKDCKWYDERISMCDNCGLPREQTFYCADGERRDSDG